MASDLQKILAKQKKQCYHSQQLGDIVAKAGKETLTFRNTASPTESAVWKRKQREHSGADWLNYSRSVRSARYARREGR